MALELLFLEIYYSKLIIIYYHFYNLNNIL